MTSLNQRKAITMDYEEYIKLEKAYNAFYVVITDIMNAKSLEDIKQKYSAMLDEINKEYINS